MNYLNQVEGLPPESAVMLAELVAGLEESGALDSGHSLRVADLAVGLGRAAGLSQAELVALGAGAFLHDIGKVAVPAAILRKPGRLSGAEWGAIQIHPQAGVALLDCFWSGWDPNVLAVVRHHHERYDGLGYPSRLAGEAIPLVARICALADSWDAMLAARSYKQELVKAEAATELLRCRSKQFDPALTDLFLQQVFPRALGPLKVCAFF